MESNYNKMEYCLGNGFELLSAPTVLAVCQDSSVFRTRFALVDYTRIIKVNGMVILPRMVGNVRTQPFV